MDATHEADFVLWSEHQAEALRRLRRGERANDVDWDNLIEEVESLGRSELHTLTSLLRRGLEHLLKAAAWPHAQPARHWLAEARTFLRDAAGAYTPAMAQRVDLPALYGDGLATIATLAELDGEPAAALPAQCPLSLAELLAPDLDIRQLAARLRV